MFAPASKHGSQRRLNRSFRPRARLWLQALEERSVPSAVITVNDHGDAAVSSVADGKCTLRETIESVNVGAAVNADVTNNMTGTFGGGDSIVFKMDTTTITLTQGQYFIGKKLTIDGTTLTNDVTINAKQKSRIFAIDAGTSAVELSSLKLTNGLVGAGESGGSIRVESGPLPLDDCELTRGEAREDGGHLYSLDQISLKNCSITGGSAAGNGGGIYLKSAASSLLDDVHVDGYAFLQGGAIYVSGGSLGITNDSFVNGISDGDGGGIYADSCTLSVDESNLNGQATAGFGGSVNSVGGSVSIANSTIEGFAQAGGGVNAVGAIVAVANCKVNADALGGDGGGGIRLEDVPTSTKSSISGSSTIIFDETDGDGGGILIIGSGLIELGDATNLVTMTGNLAYGGHGSGICIRDFSGAQSLVAVQGVAFDQVWGNGYGAGIGIVNLQAHVEIASCTFSPYSNPGIDPLFGGAIDITGVTGTAGSVTMTDCTITGTRANAGGGLSVRATNTNVTVQGSTFDGCLAQINSFSPTGPTYGGALYFDDARGTIAIDSCTITGGHAISASGAAATGGGVYIVNTPGTLTVTASSITNNLADGSGGGVVVKESDGTITFDRCTLDGNTAATAYGGGMLLDLVPEITITNSTISSNSAASFGGGIYGAFAARGHATITQCTIYGNTAVRGGGIYGQGADSAILTISTSTIAGNTAQGGDDSSTATDSRGGGIFFGNGGWDSFTIRSSIVATNQAFTSLGAGGPDIQAEDDGSGNVTAHYSLIGVDDGFTPDSPASINFTNNLLGTVATPLDPGFQPNIVGQLLADNGGPTLTLALASNSPCNDVGRNFVGLSYDQRGEPYWRVVGDAPDMGAYEHQPQGWTSATVTDVVLNEGIPLPIPVGTPSFDFSNQHSRIVNITIHFDMGVTLPSLAAPESAFVLKRVVSSGQTVTDTVAVHASLDSSGTFVTLTFDQSGTAINNYSLADGRYTLTILADKISSGNFDGDGNGTPGDDYVLAATPYLDGNNNYQAPAAGTIFRLYGDLNGNGLVSLSELSVLQQYYNSTFTSDPGACYVFDFNWNNVVGLEDFAQFQSRFNVHV